MRKTVGLAVCGVAVLALLGSACGGSSGSGSTKVSSEARPYVDAMAEAIRTDESFPGGAENAECFAAGMVNIIGVDTLETANILPEDFGSSANLDLSAVGTKKLDELVDFLFSNRCVDMVQFFADSIRSEGEDMFSNEQARCIAEKVLDQDSFRTAMRGSLAGQGDADLAESMGDVFGFISECGVKLSDLQMQS